MKHTEKLDLILRELYKYKFDGNNYSLKEICEEGTIQINPLNEVRIIAKRLERDGFINADFTFDDCFVEINSYGVEYCEGDSYTYKNESLITNNYNLSISNSPNANIVSSSNNINITISNISEIKDKINEIRNVINSLEEENEIESDLKDCLIEIETIIESNRKPKITFSKLIELGADFSSISGLILELGKLIFEQ